jgi:hypothetical protein
MLPSTSGFDTGGCSYYQISRGLFCNVDASCSPDDSRTKPVNNSGFNLTYPAFFIQPLKSALICNFSEVLHLQPFLVRCRILDVLALTILVKMRSADASNIREQEMISRIFLRAMRGWDGSLEHYPVLVVEYTELLEELMSVGHP